LGGGIGLDDGAGVNSASLRIPQKICIMRC
jgi:hypothetical protein